MDAWPNDSREVLIRVPTPERSLTLITIEEEDGEESSKSVPCPKCCACGCMAWNILVFSAIVIGLFVAFLKIAGVF